MDFRTIVGIDRARQQISHNSRVMLFGSCFAENIGERLLNARFDVDVNPFGILYNPLSVEQSLWQLVERKQYNENEIFEHEGRWHSLGHHSRFSAGEANECLKKINEQMIISSENLGNADFLFITFGTAWVYELFGTSMAVSNCHKLPGHCFTRRRLSVDEIVKRYVGLLGKLSEINPKLQVIFSVSPIRHWKDGAHGNNLSKATLLLATELIAQVFENATYFPACEIVLDELRDYRFYADDMQHLNPVAIDYIWQRFADCFFSEKTKQVAAEAERENRTLRHRQIIQD